MIYMIYRFNKVFYPGELPFSQCVCVLRKISHKSKRRGIMVYSVIKRGSPKENRDLIREGTARTLKRFET